MLGFPALPAIPLQIALYLTGLVDRAIQQGHFVSVIESSTNSIRRGHRLAGFDPTKEHPLVKDFVDSARRKLARPVQSKQPLSHDVIADITFILNTTSASLADIRFFVYPFGGYAGVFRIVKF